jgi:hypothetical protein
MVDQAVTNTDSTDAAAIPAEGTAAPANDPSSAAATETTAPEQPFSLDEDTLKKYESSQAFQEKYVPKAVFTQKTQALAEDRKRMEAERSAIFELARKALAEKAGPSGPTAEEAKYKELMDLAAAGDRDALQQMIKMEAQREMAPIRTQVTLQTAAQTARSNPEVGPYVTQAWNDIIQTMQTDPVIGQLASMNNYAAADRVMTALGYQVGFYDLKPKYEAAQNEIKALQAKVQAYEKERAASLPSSTARAGTTSGRPAAGSPTSAMDAARQAWKEMGLPESEFR